MQEQHLRHQYLEAIGIESWLARKVIPNAAPSPDWATEFSSADFDQSTAQVKALQTEAHKANAAENDSKATPSVAGIKSLSASLGQARTEQPPQKSQQDTQQHTQLDAQLDAQQHAQKQVQEQAQEQAHDTVSHLPVNDAPPAVRNEHAEAKAVQSTSRESTQPTSDASHQMPRHAPMGNRTEKAAPIMRLMIWQFKDVLVIDSVPTHTRGTMASQQYQQLLTNIVNALQYDSQLLQPNGQPFVLNWPTLAGSSIDQGWDQAVSAVQHKLAKVLHNYQPKLALLLGEHSTQIVMNVDEPFDDLKGMVFSLRSDIKAIAGYSLTQLLNVPSCKRELWIDLQKVLEN